MATDILTRIVESKKAFVANSGMSLADLKKRIKPRKRRPFLDAIQSQHPGQVNIIAEIKRASPSKGDICKDLDASKMAKKYEQGGAACLSVLTDEPYFKGCNEDLIAARAATQLPVLRKDFLITPYQIYESAMIGADAVLLIVRILSRKDLKTLLDLSHELGMDTLVEIHDETDLEKASWAGAKLIGINNRNLRSFETHIETALEIRRLLASDQIPIAASGIATRADIERNLSAGISNFLIGESLVRAEDTVRFLHTLQGI